MQAQGSVRAARPRARRVKPMRQTDGTIMAPFGCPGVEEVLTEADRKTSGTSPAGSSPPSVVASNGMAVSVLEALDGHWVCGEGSKSEGPRHLVRLIRDRHRLLARAPAGGDLAVRAWERGRVTLRTCAWRRRRTDRRLNLTARVLGPAEEHVAQSELVARARFADRIWLRLMRLRGVELLYLEITPIKPDAGGAH